MGLKYLGVSPQGGSGVGLSALAFLIALRYKQKELKQMPLSLTRLHPKFETLAPIVERKPRVRDASGNPFACLLRKIEAGQPDGAASLRRHAQNIILNF